jgi:hypothetical protein
MYFKFHYYKIIYDLGPTHIFKMKKKLRHWLCSSTIHFDYKITLHLNSQSCLLFLNIHFMLFY